MNNLTAININANMAEDIESLPPHTVMISINEENEPLWKLKVGRDEKNVLTLKFSDITADLDYKGHILKPMSSDDGVRVVRFIREHKDKNFVVHCAAGVSRSSAVCLYIHRTFGHNLRKDFWNISHPNYYVLGCLTAINHKYPEL